MSQKSHLLELPPHIMFAFEAVYEFHLSGLSDLKEPFASLYFQQMCVNFFFFFLVRKWFGSSCIYLRWYQSTRTNHAFKKEVFLNRTQKRYHTEAAKTNSKIA